MAYSLDDLLYLMQRLRDPDGGCPWDQAQDFRSITSSTVEESYELVDAIYSDDRRQIKEELGAVLFQVIFYAQMGKERDWFDFDSIVDTLTAKLVRRHPHVFPDGELTARFNGPKDEATIKQQWESIKEEERREKSHLRTLDDVPRALPALSRAQKLQKRAARVGFDWPDTTGVFAKVREELAELEEAIASRDAAHMQEEFGDLLFSLVNVARHLKIDSETAVSECNRKFERRFNSVEDALAAQGKTPHDADLHTLDALWNAAKAAEKGD